MAATEPGGTTADGRDRSLIRSALQLLATSEQKVTDCARLVRAALHAERRLDEPDERPALDAILADTSTSLNQIMTIGLDRFGRDWSGWEPPKRTMQPERDLWLALASGQALRRVLKTVAARQCDQPLVDDVQRWFAVRAALVDALERAHAAAELPGRV